MNVLKLVEKLKQLLDRYEDNKDFHYVYMSLGKWEKRKIDYLITNSGNFKDGIFHR